MSDKLNETNRADRDEPLEAGAWPTGQGPRRSEPVFNLPTILVWAIGLIFVVHIVRIGLLPRGWDLRLLFETAFIPLRYAVPLGEQSLAWLWSPVTYSFLHGDITHLLVNAIWMAAFGAVVARRIGPARFCAFWVANAVTAVALHLALHWGEEIPVIGASGVVSGLMGAAARFAFPASGRFDRRNAHFLPRLSVAESLSNRTVLIYVGIWFAINFLAAFGFSTPGEGSQIAWEAHIGGFLCGFLAFGFFDRRHWT
jgi:membrane associated rhomboid family serine protease